eukprot:1711932-Rhodomonas_salina.2
MALMSASLVPLLIMPASHPSVALIASSRVGTSMCHAVQPSAQAHRLTLLWLPNLFWQMKYLYAIFKEHQADLEIWQVWHPT